MNYTELELKVINIIADKIGIESNVIKPESFLENDLMLDDVDLEELEEVLQKEFGVAVNITEDTEVETIKQLVHHISKKL